MSPSSADEARSSCLGTTRTVYPKDPACSSTTVPENPWRPSASVGTTPGATTVSGVVEVETTAPEEGSAPFADALLLLLDLAVQGAS